MAGVTLGMRDLLRVIRAETPFRPYGDPERQNRLNKWENQTDVCGKPERHVRQNEMLFAAKRNVVCGKTECSLRQNGMQFAANRDTTLIK